MLRQVQRQTLNQLLAISCAALAFLLSLHDAATNLPVAGRHQRIDVTCSGLPSGLKQLNDARRLIVSATSNAGEAKSGEPIVAAGVIIPNLVE